MKVIHLHNLIGTDREVKCPKGGFISNRYLLEKDNMGFSLCKTIIPAGDVQHWHYLNHLEACFCTKGHGIIKDLKTGKWFEIKPDSLYVLDNHDDHTFQAFVETHLISIFNPPLTGREVHDENHSYKIIK
jgi:L-ectoine synthase